MSTSDELFQRMTITESYGELINRTITFLDIATTYTAGYMPDESRTAADQLLGVGLCVDEVLKSTDEGEEQNYIIEGEEQDYTLLKLKELGIGMCKIPEVFQNDDVAIEAFGDYLRKIGLTFCIDTKRIIGTIEETKSQIDKAPLEEVTKGLYALI